MSRFVPAGTAPEDAPAPVDDEWAAARRAVSSSKAPKQTQGTQEQSKSLYETLEANKAAKQAEFEESIRLKNQFKSLDEDDVDFLDSVLEIERAKEEAVRRETAEQLDAYRKQQAAAQKADLEAAKTNTETASNDADVWMTKKRRKKELDNPIAKVRKISTGIDSMPSTTSVVAPVSRSSREAEDTKQKDDLNRNEKASSISPAVVPTSAPVSKASTLGLGAYSSEED